MLEGNSLHSRQRFGWDLINGSAALAGCAERLHDPGHGWRVVIRHADADNTRTHAPVQRESRVTTSDRPLICHLQHCSEWLIAAIVLATLWRGWNIWLASTLRETVYWRCSSPWTGAPQTIEERFSSTGSSRISKYQQIITTHTASVFHSKFQRVHLWYELWETPT